MARPRKYSEELRRRAIDEVLERGRSIPNGAEQLGIGSAETLRKWVRQAERDSGLRPGPMTEALAEIKALRRQRFVNELPSTRVADRAAEDPCSEEVILSGGQGSHD